MLRTELFAELRRLAPRVSRLLSGLVGVRAYQLPSAYLNDIASLNRQVDLLLGRELDEAQAPGLDQAGPARIGLHEDLRRQDLPEGVEQQLEVVLGDGEGDVSKEDLELGRGRARLVVQVYPSALLAVGGQNDDSVLRGDLERLAAETRVAPSFAIS